MSIFTAKADELIALYIQRDPTNITEACELAAETLSIVLNKNITGLQVRSRWYNYTSYHHHCYDFRNLHNRKIRIRR